MTEKTEVRDLRKQDWIWTSKKLLFHKAVDEKMYKAYCGLAAFADNRTQEAFPGIDTLATRLHMSRSTVIRAVQKLEAVGIIGVKRELGKNNIYELYDVPDDPVTMPKLPPMETPASKAREFFKGVCDIRERKMETPEAVMVLSLLTQLKEKYNGADKDIIWNEIRAFERYWTELNSTGNKMLWQTKPTFEVDRRLVTWFGRKKELSRFDRTATKGSKVAVL